MASNLDGRLGLVSRRLSKTHPSAHPPHPPNQTDGRAQWSNEKKYPPSPKMDGLKHWAKKSVCLFSIMYRLVKWVSATHAMKHSAYACTRMKRESERIPWRMSWFTRRMINPSGRFRGLLWSMMDEILSMPLKERIRGSTISGFFLWHDSAVILKNWTMPIRRGNGCFRYHHSVWWKIKKNIKKGGPPAQWSLVPPSNSVVWFVNLGGFAIRPISWWPVQVVFSTKDHKPLDEKERIEEGGGLSNNFEWFVASSGIWRLSRAWEISAENQSTQDLQSMGWTCVGNGPMSRCRNWPEYSYRLLLACMACGCKYPTRISEN